MIHASADRRVSSSASLIVLPAIPCKPLSRSAERSAWGSTGSVLIARAHETWAARTLPMPHCWTVPIIQRSCLARAAGSVLACLLLAGCSSQLPPGYVMVEDHADARFRAVSADNCVLTLRSETNPRGGDLAFWEKAITQRLTDVRGYHVVSRFEVDNPAARGIEIVFDYTRDGTDYTYLLGLFVKGRAVHVFEAAGQKGRIQKDMAEITKTMQKWPL